MNTTAVLAWLLVAALVILIIFRHFKKRDDKEDKSTAHPGQRMIWPFGIALLFLLVIIGVQHFGLPGKQEQKKTNIQEDGMPAVTPDELANAVGTNEDRIAGTFINKNFKRNVIGPQIFYILYSPKAKEITDPDEKILEYAYLQSGSENMITYVVKNEDTYNSFIKTLIALGADSVDKAKYNNSDDYIGDYAAYKYKNRVFVDRKYWIENKGNSIICFTSDLLQAGKKTPAIVKPPVKDCLSYKDSYRFAQNDLCFITLYSRNGNVFKFVGKMQGTDNISGSVEKQGDQWVVISGNAKGTFAIINGCQTLMADIIVEKSGLVSKYSLELKRQ